MRDGRFYPDHGLERIVDYHERQDARFAQAAADGLRRDRQADPHRDRARGRRARQRGPGDGARDRPPLLSVGEPGGHRARAPVALRPLPAAPRPRLTRRGGAPRLRIVATVLLALAARASACVAWRARRAAPPPRRERPTSRRRRPRWSRRAGSRTCSPTRSRAARLASTVSEQRRAVQRVRRGRRPARTRRALASVQRRPRARAGVDAEAARPRVAALAVLGADHRSRTRALARTATATCISSVAAIRCSRRRPTSS